MEIHIAENAGFCFGVERATKELERELASSNGKRRVITLGKIIHNERYTEKITKMGAEEADTCDIDRIIQMAEEGEAISLAAHFAYNLLETTGCTLVLTCNLQFPATFPGAGSRRYWV